MNSWSKSRHETKKFKGLANSPCLQIVYHWLREKMPIFRRANLERLTLTPSVWKDTQSPENKIKHSMKLLYKYQELLTLYTWHIYLRYIRWRQEYHMEYWLISCCRGLGHTTLWYLQGKYSVRTHTMRIVYAHTPCVYSVRTYTKRTIYSGQRTVSPITTTIITTLIMVCTLNSLVYTGLLVLW